MRPKSSAKWFTPEVIAPRKADLPPSALGGTRDELYGALGEARDRKARVMSDAPEFRGGGDLGNWLKLGGSLLNVYNAREAETEAEKRYREHMRQYNDLFSGMGKDTDFDGLVQAMMASGNATAQEQATQLRLAQLAREPEEPTLKTIPMGDQDVTGYFKDGQFTPIASGARWKPGSGGPTEHAYQRAGNIVAPDGTMLGAGSYDKRSGQMLYVGPDGSLQVAPPGSREVPEGMGGAINAQQFNQLEMELETERNSLERLARYFGSVGDMRTGIDRWADQVALQAKTLMGDQATAEELATAVASGQLQGLLGMFRTEIVGPGVMTEYDAQRVIAALGGDIGALQNPQVVRELLGSLYESKLRRVQTLQTQYERSAPVFGVQPSPLDYAPSLDDQMSRGQGGGEAEPAAPAPMPRQGETQVDDEGVTWVFVGSDPNNPTHWKRAEAPQFWGGQ